MAFVKNQYSQVPLLWPFVVWPKQNSQRAVSLHCLLTQKEETQAVVQVTCMYHQLWLWNLCWGCCRRLDCWKQLKVQALPFLEISLVSFS